MQIFNFNKITCGLIVAFLLVTMVSFIGQVNAQAPPDMSNMQGMPKMITGQYSNSEYGVQMTLPDGWQAMEVNSATTTSVMITNTPPDSSNSGSSSMTMISLAMMPKPTTTTTDTPNVPIDPKYKCDPASSDNTNVNGMSAIVTVIQCTGPDGDMKMKSYSFQTDKNIVSASYVAVPASLYDSNVATFDSTIKTLQIANTVSASSVPTTAQNPTSSSAVPEFPIQVIVVFAVVIGMSLLLSKTKLSGLNIK